MQYYLSLLIFTVALGIFISLFYLLYTFYKNKKLNKISHLPFTKEYISIVKKIPFYNKLTDTEQKEIQTSILIFINTKEFIGIDIKVTQEMKIVIAFHACLLILHIDTIKCYENLKTVIIYSHTIITKQINSNGGIYTKSDFLIEGQSANDTVIISWEDAKKDAYHIKESNVILHEFTHEIDFMNGEINGTPPLPYAKYDEWARVLSREFNALKEVSLKNRYWGKFKLIGDYASTNEAEFFAVITERFFEEPKALKQKFPDLYKELDSFYKINPIKLI